MKNLWAGISGIIENNEKPLNRAIIEIFEEVGMKKAEVKLLKEGDVIMIESPQYENHQWEVYPILFSCNHKEIKLNRENSDAQWIDVKAINDFTTVPSLEKVLTRLF